MLQKNRPLSKKDRLMRLLAIPLRILLIAVSALAGNIAGDYLRQHYRGRPGHQWRLLHTNQDGQTVVALNPVVTNFLPALLLGLFMTPGSLLAFAAGALTSFLVGERYEISFWDLVDLWVPTGRKPTRR